MGPSRRFIRQVLSFSKSPIMSARQVIIHNTVFTEEESIKFKEIICNVGTILASYKSYLMVKLTLHKDWLSSMFISVSI